MNKRTMAILAGITALSALFTTQADEAAGAAAPALSDVIKAVSVIVGIAEQKHIPLGTNSPEAAARGLLLSLDPNADILDESAAQELLSNEKGVFIGIGISAALKDNWPVISGILPDSPAAAADIKLGDRIEAIDGEPQKGCSSEQIAASFHGERGAPITLTLRDPDKDAQERSVTLQRALLQEPCLAAKELWLDNIVYLKFNGLYAKAGQTVKDVLRARASTNTAGLILDLRGAGGKDLVSVREIAGAFAEEDAVLFKIRDEQGSEIETYKAQDVRHLGVPALALIDENTTGASEALAAVLREHKGIVFIGAPTAGDDRLRELIPLDDGRILRIGTTRIDVAPARSYRGTGVAPDIAVSREAIEKEQALYLMEDEADENGVVKTGLTDREKQVRALRRQLRGDAVAKRAVDLLLGLQALSIRAP